ncbi:hypothetical protein FALCPG4_018112 [Fusarium falciforme]
MSTDLVLSRGCRHNDWWSMPQTSVEFCRSCGFSLIYAASRPSKDVYAEVQVQPRPQDTFDPARVTPPGARSYQYQPLDLTNGRQIHVLVLKAGRLEDPLQCELEHANLQQGPSTKRFRTPGPTIKVMTQSAEQYNAAMMSNILERNHQVKNMIAIFRSAIRVVLFLGEGNPILDRLVDYMSNDTGGQLPQVTDFISLFRSRWFHRVWVLQEVAAAKSISVTYGMKQMSWVDLIRHGNLFLRLMAARNLSLVLPPVISYGLRQTEAGDCRLRGRSDLLSLLQVSRNCACKDARDKVYSILGLLQEEPVLSLQADYSPSTTASWVFLQVAAWHVDTTKTLEILSQVDGTSALYMPSWVPDWTRKSPNALPPRFKVPQEFSAPRIRALDNQTLHSTARFSYPLGCVLEVTGRRYGTVWTDRKIFGKALVLSGSAGRATDSNKSDPHGRILSLYHGATPSSDFKADDTVFRADIPPAFGGFCSNFFEMDQMHWQRIKRAMKLDVNQATEQATKQAMASWDTANWVSEYTISQTTKDTIEKVLEQATKDAAGEAIRQVTIDSNWVTWANKMAISKSIHQSIKQASERAMTMTNQPFPDRAIQQATDQHAEVVEEAVNRTIELANKKVTCCCMSQSPSPGHFGKDELDNFITNMRQYGMGRRIFGTDHSLGLGPTELEDWGEPDYG